MFKKELKMLEAKGLLREIKSLGSPQGARIKISGNEYINFSSNDYLGLANNPYITKSVLQAVEEFGLGSGASRLLGGGSILHKELEEKTAKFKSTESALVFNSGYSANTGIIPAIASEEDAIFSDELNHASIVDGCRLSNARTIIYPHKDIGYLKSQVKKVTAKRKIIVTDSVFSMDGDIAPLKEIYDICLTLNAQRSTPDVFLYIDDAHATGVLGEGRGSLEHLGIKPETWIIQMGTFSKALGSFGAFVAGSKDTVNWILNNARSFIFSTALPSCIAAASLTALKIVEKNPSLIEKLWVNREKTIKELTSLGYDTMGSETPIIPIKTKTIKNTLRISKALLHKGIFAPAIRPPTVNEPRIRITVTAAHTDEDIEKLIEAIKLIKGNTR